MKLGRRGLMNAKSNALLKKLFVSKGIIVCEICHSPYNLTWMHRKKRRHYNSVEELSDFNEVILACLTCHQKYEMDRVKTEELFIRLRGSMLK